MALPSLVVILHAENTVRVLVERAMEGVARPVYLEDVERSGRPQILRDAGAILSFDISRELAPDEFPLIGNALLLQFLTAGVDHLPLRALAPQLRIAANAGAYAEPVAEHALAMALAAAKRLLGEHRNLQRGEFNQTTPNRLLSGSVCGIFGYGGIGTAAARLLHGIGMRIHAVNRRGVGDSACAWVGTPDQLNELLRTSDVLIVSVPLTRATAGCIGPTELGLMKPDAILVNVARGGIIDERALFEHLRRNPRFMACIDTWWEEPLPRGRFKPAYPFLDLPNVIGSPHNSPMIPGIHQIAIKRAVENCRLALSGELPLHVIGDEERMR